MCECADPPADRQRCAQDVPAPTRPDRHDHAAAGEGREVQGELPQSMCVWGISKGGVLVWQVQGSVAHHTLSDTGACLTCVSCHCWALQQGSGPLFPSMTKRGTYQRRVIAVFEDPFETEAYVHTPPPLTDRTTAYLSPPLNPTAATLPPPMWPIIAVLLLPPPDLFVVLLCSGQVEMSRGLNLLQQKQRATALAVSRALPPPCPPRGTTNSYVTHSSRRLTTGFSIAYSDQPRDMQPHFRS